MLGIEVPLDRRGQEVRWKKGTRLHISAILDRNRIFSFNTKVLGYNTFQRESILFTEHAQNIKQTQKRRSQRKELDRPCYFFPVEIMTMAEGRKTVKRAMLNKNLRHLGTMVDISAGGCCIKARNPLKAGSLLKIEFETQRKVHVTVFGKVRGVDQDPPHGGYMHVMFTRISKKNLNKIQEYVYEIDKEQVVYY
jgi:c-di-GMP-binding flagellar brake protein YcgR